MTDTITLPRELVKEALEALEDFVYHGESTGWLQVVKALRTALAAEQPKPEPVAWQCREHGDDEWFDCSKEAYGINPSRYVYRRLYTAPPDSEALRREIERLREALKLALNSHGRMLMSDPPQDAWKFNRVDEVIVAALRREETT